MYKLISKLESSTDPEKLLYEWVKTGVITLMEFRQLVLDMKRAARDSGYEEGYDAAAFSAAEEAAGENI